MSPAVVATCAALAACLALPSRAALLPTSPTASPAAHDSGADPGWLRRHRVVWAALADVAAWVFVPGPLRWCAAPGAAAAAWWAATRAEAPAVRRAREEARRDLPHVVGLLGDALRAGRAPAEALEVVATALPGAAADRLARVAPRLRLGMDPDDVWSDLARDPALAPLGRTLARAHATGASVVTAVDRLAESLAEDARGTVEDRARAVGVQAALPLGLCLLPSFVLLGIVPLVAGMLDGLAW